MLARFYYFPIRGNSIVIDMCGDSNKVFNGYSPVCMGYYEVGKRKLNYVEMANRVCEFLFNKHDDYISAIQSTTQIHTFYSCESGVEMVNIYLTIYCGDCDLRIYSKDVLISKECLNSWDTDEETRDVITTEVLRMKNVYEETYS